MLCVWQDENWKVIFYTEYNFGAYALYKDEEFKRKINTVETERSSKDYELNIINGLLIDEHNAGNYKFTSRKLNEIIK